VSESDAETDHVNGLGTVVVDERGGRRLLIAPQAGDALRVAWANYLSGIPSVTDALTRRLSEPTSCEFVQRVPTG
jgi:hypothetical protein